MLPLKNFLSVGGNFKFLGGIPPYSPPAKYPSNWISYWLADNSVICKLSLQGLFFLVLGAIFTFWLKISNKTIIGFDFFLLEMYI